MRRAVLPSAIGLAILAMIAGCIHLFQAASSPPSTEYAVHISRQFTADERSWLREAAAEWQYSAPGLTLEVIVDTCSQSAYAMETICIYPSTKEEIYDQGCPEAKHPIGCEGRHGGVYEIRILNTVGGDRFARVARHELGHAFGLGHDELPQDSGKSVMMQDVENDADHVTCVDVEAFWRLRHTSRECLAL